MVWRLVNVPGVGWAPLPSAEDCGPKLPCRRWSELNEAERAEVIASARKRLLGSSEFHDLALQSASEVGLAATATRRLRRCVCVAICAGLSYKALCRCRAIY